MVVSWAMLSPIVALVLLALSMAEPRAPMSGISDLDTSFRRLRRCVIQTDTFCGLGTTAVLAAVANKIYERRAHSGDARVSRATLGTKPQLARG